MNMDLRNIIVIDTETGGLDPDVHAILSLALCRGDGSAPFDVMIRDVGGACTDEAMAVNRIVLSAHMENAVSPAMACVMINEWIAAVIATNPGEKLKLAGHNVAFDIGFARRLCRIGGHPPPRLFGPHRTIDTHAILWADFARGRIPIEATTSDGAFRHFGITVPADARHTALGDALATAALLRALTFNAAMA